MTALTNKTLLLTLAASGALLATALVLMPAADVPAPQPAGTESAAPITAPPQPAAFEREVAAADTAAPAGFYGAPIGQVMRFDWESRSRIALQRAADGQGTEVTMNLHGKAEIVVIARKGRELIAEVTFPQTAGEVASTAGGNTIDEDHPVAADFRKPLRVRMNDDGSTLAFAFAEDVQPEHRNWLRGIWAGSRFVARDAATWSTVERDVVGEAELEYRWLSPTVVDDRTVGGRVARQKTGYRAAADAGTSVGLEATGAGEAVLNPDLGWFENTLWQETVTQRLEEVAAVIVTNQRVQWQLRDLDFRTVTDVAAVWQSEWQPVGADGAREGGVDRRYEERRLADVTVEQLLADLAALVQAEGDAHDVYLKKLDLTLLMQLRPDALAKVQAVLPRLGDDVAQLAISAMAASETPAAQAIVADLFAADDAPLLQRQAAAFSMVQVMHPDPATVAAFAKAVGRATVHGEGITEGVLALGTLVGRSEGQAQRDGLRDLLALESVAIESGALANWIEAVGNTGLPAALDVALRYRDDADVVVRAATVAAVRLVPGVDAFTFAVSKLGDTVPVVRVRAAETLLMRAEPETFSVLADYLAQEPETRLREAVVRLIANRLPEAAARGLLQRIATGDAEASVRQAANELL